MQNYKIIDKCRVCGSRELKKVLALEPQYIGTTFVKDNDSHPMSKIKIPLTLMLCEECKLVQLAETTNPELLYRDYYYRTSVNETMKKDLRELVEEVFERVKPSRGDYVIDIGANDMTTIQMFPNFLNRIGVEPAKNIDWSNVSKDVCIVNDFFNKESILPYLNGKKAKIITATAMFYDLDEPNKFTQDIKELLDIDGMAVIQISHLLATIKDFNFYDICHEHLEYYSLKSIEYLMDKNGLCIYDCETNFVNGGSLRLYIVHNENALVKTKRYHDLLLEEEKYKINDIETYKEFDKRIKEMSKKTKDFIIEEIKKQGMVVGLGASTKSSVLLQVCGIGKEIMPCISDRSEIKVGRKMLGLDIPLVSEEEVRKLNPSTMFILPWNFKNEIVEREKEYIDNGGKMLFALPYPYILDKNGEYKL
jgi:hypothetical protein